MRRRRERPDLEDVMPAVFMVLGIAALMLIAWWLGR